MYLITKIESFDEKQSATRHCQMYGSFKLAVCQVLSHSIVHHIAPIDQTRLTLSAYRSAALLSLTAFCSYTVTFACA